MKLITNARELDSEFLRLIKNYRKFYWAIAWASHKSKAFHELKKNTNKISRIIVGLHFYQTHPEFIRDFLSCKNIKYIKQSEGTFHPKMYLFENSDTEWELLLGSGNFTDQALTINTEAFFLLNFTSDQSRKIYQNCHTLINRCWQDAELFKEEELESYSKTWQKHLRKRNSISGKYGVKSKSKPIYKSVIANLNWDGFINRVKREGTNKIEDRLKVVEKAHYYFTKVRKFNDMSENIRKAIAATYYGDRGIDNLNWKYFGSMWGMGDFKNRIISNDENISVALDQIPLYGNLTRNHFEKYISNFREAIKSKNPIGTATRLLAMKRPDVFVCIDNKNIRKLCKDFGIIQSGLNIDNYWDLIIERIFDSDWWQVTEPKHDLEIRIEFARSALLDALYYEG